MSATTTASELVFEKIIEELVAGNGTEAAAGRNATVHYTG